MRLVLVLHLMLALILPLPFMVRSFRSTRVIASIALSTKATSKDFDVERVCSDKSFPTYNTLKTTTTKSLPPYIVHIKALREYENIEQLLTEATDLSLDYIRELLQFGAIYMSTSIPGKFYHKRGIIYCSNIHFFVNL